MSDLQCTKCSSDVKMQVVCVQQKTGWSVLFPCGWSGCDVVVGDLLSSCPMLVADLPAALHTWPAVAISHLYTTPLTCNSS
jgi:hypothetical protein